MTLPGCLPTSSPSQIFHQSSAMPTRAAGLPSRAAGKSSDAFSTSRYRFTQRESETSQRTFSAAKPQDLEFQRSLRSYPSPVKAQVGTKRQQSSRSSPNLIKEQALSKPSLRSVPVKRPSTRILYSEDDAQRDLSSLESSAKLLAASIQCNRKRLSESQIEHMAETGKSIRTLMQKIKKTDPTSLDTATFRKLTVQHKNKVDNHLWDIGNKHVRQTPPRPAVRKPPEPLTPVAIYRQEKHAAMAKQFRLHRKDMQKELAANGQTDEIYADKRDNISVAELKTFTKKTDASTIASTHHLLARDTSNNSVRKTPPRPTVWQPLQPLTPIAIHLKEKHAAIAEQFRLHRKDMQKKLAANGETDEIYANKRDNISVAEPEIATEKTDENTIADVRHVLDSLHDFIDEDYLRMLRLANETDQDIGYVSQHSREEPSSPDSPSLKKRVSSADENADKKEMPPKLHASEDRTSS